MKVRVVKDGFGSYSSAEAVVSSIDGVGLTRRISFIYRPPRHRSDSVCVAVSHL